MPEPGRAALDASRSSREVDINNDQYQKAYLSWKRGHVTDQGIEEVFGSEWLFLFQVQRDGVGDDTMSGIGGENVVPAATQIDVPGMGADGGSLVQAWQHPLQPGGVSLELDEDSQHTTTGKDKTK